MPELSPTENYNTYPCHDTSNLVKGERDGGTLGGYFIIRSHSAVIFKLLYQCGKRSNTVLR